jgi:PDZ domain-containing protein
MRRPASGWSPEGGNRPLRWIGRVLLLLVAVFAFFTVPIPIFYMFLPGPVRDVQELVRVSNAPTYSSEGPLYMTTVSVDISVTAAEMVEAGLDPDKQIVLRSEVTGGEPLPVAERRQRAAMDQSQQYAREVALEALGLGRRSGGGARLVAIQEDAPAAEVLRPGDVIVSVNDEPVVTMCDVGTAMENTEAGEAVELVVRRNGEPETLSVETIAQEGTGAPLIGVVVETAGQFRSDVDVDFRTGRVAGPSAGLMLTLALYDRLTPQDLTGGRAVAGTGEIRCRGEVGPIGGVVQKVAAAEARGADVFLSPLGNFEQARAAAEEMRVVAVADFQDAVDYLEAPSV